MAARNLKSKKNSNNRLKNLSFVFMSLSFTSFIVAYVIHFYDIPHSKASADDSTDSSWISNLKHLVWGHKGASKENHAIVSKWKTAFDFYVAFMEKLFHAISQAGIYFTIVCQCSLIIGKKAWVFICDTILHIYEVSMPLCTNMTAYNDRNSTMTQAIYNSFKQISVVIPKEILDVLQAKQSIIIATFVLLIIVCLIWYKCKKKAKFKDDLDTSQSRCFKATWIHCVEVLYRSVVILMPLSLLLSLPWEFMRLYQTEVAKNAALTLQGMPAECLPDQMSKWQTLRAWSVWLFSWSSDPCEQYHTALLVDPLWHVTPAMVMSSAFTRCLVRPVELVSASLGNSLRLLLSEIPLPWQPFVLIGVIAISLLMIIMGFRYRLSLPFFLRIEPSHNDACKKCAHISSYPSLARKSTKQKSIHREKLSSGGNSPVLGKKYLSIIDTDPVQNHHYSTRSRAPLKSAKSFDTLQQLTRSPINSEENNGRLDSERYHNSCLHDSVSSHDDSCISDSHSWSLQDSSFDTSVYKVI